MYAVIKAGGRQYRVSPGEDLRMEKIPGSKGDQVVFDQVLLTSDGDKVNIGAPLIGGTKVTGRILRQGRDRKIVVFKVKRRKGYRKKRGHRQPFTLIKIDQIEA